MGAVCCKGLTTTEAPGAAAGVPPGGAGSSPSSSLSSTATAGGGGGGSAGGLLGTPGVPSRRDSERRGIRQGLVLERKHVSVWDHYDKIGEIGTGMTGKVYLVTSKTTGERFALKSMSVSRIEPELLEDLRNEIAILKMMDHPSIIKMYEYYEDDANIYLILEYCSGGELFDRLHEQRENRYTEAEAARLVMRMTAAVGYCHYMGISHRDLKLENFIFDSPGPDANIKLIDFGLSAKYGTSLRRMHTIVGTPYYVAPEVFNQPELGNRGYTNACDCWSLGVIAYMLLSGTPPFRGRRDREVLLAVRRGKYTLSGPKWDAISEEAKDFIRRLLVYNPAKRMTAEQALKHPWLQKARHEATARPLDPEILSNLRDFSKLSTLKRAALEAIAFTMSAESISHLRDQFAKLDEDQTGFVTLNEFINVLSSAGTSREEALSIFQGIADHATASISYTEFLAASLSRRLWLSRERLRDAFQRLDVDGSGYITRASLKAVLGDEWSPEKVEAMFREADTKGDGRIDFEEFLASMTKESHEALLDVLPAGGGVNSSGGSTSGGGGGTGLTSSASLLSLGGASTASGVNTPVAGGSAGGLGQPAVPTAPASPPGGSSRSSGGLGLSLEGSGGGFRPDGEGLSSALAAASAGGALPSASPPPPSAAVPPLSPMPVGGAVAVLEPTARDEGAAAPLLPGGGDAAPSLAAGPQLGSR